MRRHPGTKIKSTLNYLRGEVAPLHRAGVEERDGLDTREDHVLGHLHAQPAQAWGGVGGELVD